MLAYNIALPSEGLPSLPVGFPIEWEDAVDVESFVFPWESYRGAYSAVDFGTYTMRDLVWATTTEPLLSPRRNGKTFVRLTTKDGQTLLVYIS